MLPYWVEFREFRAEKIRPFLKRVFGTGQVPVLEDAFTLLDQAIARRESCRGYPWSELESIRDALKRGILLVFHRATTQQRNKRFYRHLASFLLYEALPSNKSTDKIAVVSLNWDCLLEDSIYDCLWDCGCTSRPSTYLRNKSVPRADIDYCCYTTPLGLHCPHTPSVKQKAAGILNFKVLKLHGSTNWVQCPNCMRLYTGIGGTEDVWALYAQPQQCPHCKALGLIPKPRSHTSRDPKAIYLEPFFITPTFVKVFDNAHIQGIWHNAYVNLAEASKIVFLGYSLPEADYHVRTLLRRAIRKNTQIEVVLSKNDDPSGLRMPESIRQKYALSRYQRFFGSNRMATHVGGIREYFHRNLSSKSAGALLKEFKAGLLSRLPT